MTFAGPSRVWGCGRRSQFCPCLREVRRSQRVRRPAGPGPPSGHCKRGHTRFWRGAEGVGRPPLPRLRADTPAPSSPGVCAEGEKFRPPAPEGAGGGAEPLRAFLPGPGFSKGPWVQQTGLLLAGRGWAKDRRTRSRLWHPRDWHGSPWVAGACAPRDAPSPVVRPSGCPGSPRWRAPAPEGAVASARWPRRGRCGSSLWSLIRRALSGVLSPSSHRG